VRTEQLRREYGLSLHHTAFPLHPEIPEEGVDLADLFAGRGIDLAASFARLRTVADEVGLPLGERARTFNSRRAQELGKWAEEKGRGEVFRAAVYRAYFVAGCNIARPEELVEIASEISLDKDEALQVLRERRYAKPSMPIGNAPANWGSTQSQHFFTSSVPWSDLLPTKICAV